MRTLEMESFRSQETMFLQAMDRFVDDREYSPKSSSPHFAFFNAAYTNKIHNFKYHAKCEEIGVATTIGKMRDEDERGCLHFAAAGGSLEVCKYLIETLKLDVDPKDEHGHTPLYHAAIKGRLKTVRYLLEMGANADAATDTNYTPLHCAAKIGNTKIMTLLLSRGARVDVASRTGTALQRAASCGHRGAVRVLLDHSANPNVVTSQGMLRPLMSAILGKSWETMELLLQAGADPNAVSCGSSPLIFAARDGRVDDIKRLLEAGADPNYTMNAGLTALEIAAIECNHPIVRVLFPVTSRIPTYPDWSIGGLMKDVNSAANKTQRVVHAEEKFHQAKSKGRDAFQGEQYLMAAHWFQEALAISPKDAAVLSNLSACYACLDDGIEALDYATKCMYERPEWPKAHYRMGVAHSILKVQ
ncbi:ankyrin-3-like isoform X2 [Papaver somniferum]|uniref:ankyrin-3-like isoform X2 n=1 Tax=Papaver somniferum TaxID=3469 RepID=UPI000E6F81AB|nr:ankyrin-3-like isoform X2 [Papaver somniferum]